MTITNTTLREDIDVVTRQVWANILDLPVELGTAELSSVTTTSSVQILGEWTGAVALTMSAELATTIACTMFCMEADELSDEDVADAAGEMANMIGGNIKSLLPGPSELSMPTVTSGDHEVTAFPGTELVERVSFTASGQPFVVSLVQLRDDETTEDTNEDTERNQQ
jgi:chemotaxis protein CheX